MKFFFGIALGVLGMWAYENGKLAALVAALPEPVRQVVQPAAERLNQATSGKPVHDAPDVVGRTSETLGA